MSWIAFVYLSIFGTRIVDLVGSHTITPRFYEWEEKKWMLLNFKLLKYVFDCLFICTICKYTWWHCWRIENISLNQSHIWNRWSPFMAHQTKEQSITPKLLKDVRFSGLLIFVFFYILLIDIPVIWMSYSDHRYQLQCQTYASTKMIPSIKRKPGKWHSKMEWI